MIIFGSNSPSKWTPRVVVIVDGQRFDYEAARFASSYEDSLLVARDAVAKHGHNLPNEDWVLVNTKPVTQDVEKALGK